MKRYIVLFCTAILLPLLFTSCKKDKVDQQEEEPIQEGVYNPQKKIDKVFSEWRMIGQVLSEETNTWETVDYGESESYSEAWQWNGDLLESIRYYRDGEEYRRAVFSYQNNRISSISETDDITAWRNLTYYYSYDGDKLSSIRAFQGSTLVEDYQIIHTGNKITRILFFENYSSTKDFDNIFLPCPTAVRSVLGRIRTLMKSKHESKDYSCSGALDLQWVGNNIVRASVTEDFEGDHWVVEYTYDTKVNPYYGMLFEYGHDGYRDMFTSQNNILTEKCTYLESEGVAWCDEYSYTYNGEWPISVRSLVSASSYYNNSSREMNETISHYIYR